jgi:hypothetical protein
MSITQPNCRLSSIQFPGVAINYVLQIQQWLASSKTWCRDSKTMILEKDYIVWSCSPIMTWIYKTLDAYK